MANDATKPLGKSLCITIVAAAADLCATLYRVPRCIVPFDRRAVRHKVNVPRTFSAVNNRGPSGVGSPKPGWLRGTSRHGTGHRLREGPAARTMGGGAEPGCAHSDRETTPWTSDCTASRR